MARLSRRLNKEATVTLSYIEHAAPSHHLNGRPWKDWKFSWETVAKAIAVNEPLELD